MAGLRNVNLGPAADGGGPPPDASIGRYGAKSYARGTTVMQASLQR